MMQLISRTKHHSRAASPSPMGSDVEEQATPVRANKAYESSTLFSTFNNFLRRQIQKTTGKEPALIYWRLQYQWTLLSGRSKLATVFVVLFLVQYIVLGLWDHFALQVGDLSSLSTSAKPSTAQHFAVAINTYKRPDMLREAVQHYASTCGPQAGVGQVFVIWAEQTSRNPDPGSFFTKNDREPKNRSQVYILKKSKDSLNSRFEPIPQLDTDAVFMVDDDLRVACPSLLDAFHAWKQNPDSMVGYYPRLASTPRGEPASQDLIYHTWPAVFWRQSFNMILTKASFLHAKYLDLYTDDTKFPRAIKNHVDQHMNCEDIAMSILVANHTKFEKGTPARPIYVEGSVSDKGLIGGISSGSGHMTTRSGCLTQLTTIIREKGWGSPLDYQVSLPQNSWIRHVFWWKYRPSNVFEWLALANTFT